MARGLKLTGESAREDRAKKRGNGAKMSVLTEYNRNKVQRLLES